MKLECAICKHDRLLHCFSGPQCSQCVNTVVCNACMLQIIEVCVTDMPSINEGDEMRIQQIEYCSTDYKCPTCRRVSTFDYNTGKLNWLNNLLTKMPDHQYPFRVNVISTVDRPAVSITMVACAMPGHIQFRYVVVDTETGLPEGLPATHCVPIELAKVDFLSY